MNSPSLSNPTALINSIRPASGPRFIPIDIQSTWQSLVTTTVQDDSGVARTLRQLITPSGMEVSFVIHSPSDMPVMKRHIERQGYDASFAFTGTSHETLSDSDRRAVAANRSHSEEKLNCVDLIGKKVFITLSAHSVALIDFAGLLQNVSLDALDIRRDLYVGRVTPQARAFMEATLVGSLIDEKGAPKQKFDFEGELLVVQSLTGDETARAAVAKRHLLLEDSDYRHAHKPSRDELDSGAITLSDLIAVHATSHLPARLADGTWTVSPRINFSALKVPRTTVHFTLNHHVTSHMMGNWTDAEFVLFCPVEAAIEQNGIPYSLLGVDTFFVLPPGENCRLPAGRTQLLKKGPLPDDLVVFKVSDDEWHYDASFSPRRLEILARNKADQLSDFEVDLRWLLGAAFGIKSMTISEDSSPIHAQVAQLLSFEVYEQRNGEGNVAGYSYMLFESKPKFLPLLAGGPGLEGLEETFQAAGLGREFRAASDKINSLLKTFFQPSAKRFSVEAIIESLGATVYSGGGWDWSDGNSARKLHALGEQIGAPCVAHTNTWIGLAEETARMLLVHRGRSGLSFDDECNGARTRGIGPEIAIRLPADVRTAHYLAGTFAR